MTQSEQNGEERPLTLEDLPAGEAAFRAFMREYIRQHFSVLPGEDVILLDRAGGWERLRQRYGTAQRRLSRRKPAKAA